MKKIICILIFIIGLSLRIYFILSRDISTDEVFYTSVAYFSSISQIIKIEHWIKDHGILYYLFLKFFLVFTKDIVLLRLSNLLFYISLFLLIYKIIRNKNVRFLLLFLFSFYDYFIFMNSMISPFNMVLFFFFISLIFLYWLEFSDLKKYQKKIFLIIFPFILVLGFYSDYSFFYSYFFYFFYLINLILTRKKEKYLIFINSFLIAQIFIIPGIFKFLNNFINLKNLFPHPIYRELNFFSYLKLFFNFIFLRLNNEFLNLIFFIIFVIFTISILLKDDNFRLKKFFTIFLLTLISIFFFIFYFSSSLFSLLIERSFWPIYILSIFILAFLYVLLNKKSFLQGLFFIFLIFFLYFRYQSKLSLEYGSVPCGNFQFNNFLKEIKRDFKDKNITFLIFDKNYTFIPLVDYYLNPRFKNYLSNSQFIYYPIYHREERVFYEINNSSDRIFIILKFITDGLDNFLIKVERKLNQLPKNKVYFYHLLYNNKTKDTYYFVREN